ncbi:hypothetical protein HMPREF0262_03715 [Clostridium sp. ATCC 29733]|nr:hypothetical protein HMPREF0262_03715 [Clostridium sp. ATCC 29733]
MFSTVCRAPLQSGCRGREERSGRRIFLSPCTPPCLAEEERGGLTGHKTSIVV